MDWTKKASDWWVAGRFNVGAALGLAAGKYVFDFYSESADIWSRFVFSGFGSGLGGNASGWSLPGIVDPWTELPAVNPFSANDLHMCPGTLWTVSVGVGAGVGTMKISAISWHRLFEEVEVGGISGEFGAGALAMAGRWRFAKHLIVDNDATIA
jgi:hypothetical protein